MSQIPMVHIISEDKTGGGLQQIIAEAVRMKRSSLGCPPLAFSKKPGYANGNAELLKKCAAYDEFRFHYSPKYDHVVFVIDARNAWDVLRQVEPPPMGQHLAEGYLEKLKATICAEMTRLARGEQRTDEQWEQIRAGFHPHVLVWERESLILGAAAHLELGSAIEDVYAIRGAYERVIELYRAHRDRKYAKATDGKACLQAVASNPVALTQVVNSNPSLQAIVDDLASL